MYGPPAGERSGVRVREPANFAVEGSREKGLPALSYFGQAARRPSKTTGTSQKCRQVLFAASFCWASKTTLSCPVYRVQPLGIGAGLTSRPSVASCTSITTSAVFLLSHRMRSWEPRPACPHNHHLLQTPSHSSPCLFPLLDCFLLSSHKLGCYCSLETNRSCSSPQDLSIQKTLPQPRPTMAATSNLTLLMKVFEQEKALFWMNNPGLPEEELQRKWAAQTGKFHSILGTPTPDETIPRYPLSSSSAPRMKREQSV